jgi:hypothetical protein
MPIKFMLCKASPNFGLLAVQGFTESGMELAQYLLKCSSYINAPLIDYGANPLIP